MFKRSLLVLVAFVVMCIVACAQDQKEKPQSPPEPSKTEEPSKPAEPAKPAPHLPLPCITVEGVGGIFITETAYLVNPSQGDQWVGMPSVGFSFASVGDKDFESLGATMTFFKRLELGFAHERFGMGSWPKDVMKATGLDLRQQSASMEVFNVRAMLVEEKGWMPAVTAGVHYKYNEDIWDVNRDLMGACKALGVKHNDGVDYTLMVSKTFVGILPRPFILSAGVRNTNAVQTGLLGFTDERDTVAEANAVFFLTDKLLFAAEYRQKPDNLKRFPGLVGKEDDWWTACLAYVVNEHMTIAGGWAHFGNVMNNEENGVLGIHLKWEF
jgi:hypothetical protein